MLSDKLAEKMGRYKDSYSEFGQLVSKIWRLIRPVVDTGIHSKGLPFYYIPTKNHPNHSDRLTHIDCKGKLALQETGYYNKA